MTRHLPIVPLLCAGLAAPCAAQDITDEDIFVEANLLSVFYHEMGHALIDVMRLPVFGQEEDAADVASILLIDSIFDAESALDLAYDSALGFAAEAMWEEEMALEPAFWDVHGSSEQRFYNTVCLFYGADPDGRDDFAADMDLPEERALTCEEEFILAEESWGPVLDEVFGADGPEMTLQILSGTGLTADLIAEEVAYLNENLRLPEALTVSVEACGEINAFYIPDARAIVMCTEFEGYLRELYQLSSG
ncbi:hypothetical protein FIU97_01310 [Roseivivax sp. THAF40]|uniref:DUF4344 domain-containing metallopeptidase n=1 Tax=unclassified Roseivivax TaxID=2639302 RepID=UPI0012681271|nr:MULTISPECIES: DUF4344 domain-containing metallopeptidase [unclassified Roseivivax]QFS81471.1 hypothetical protein FIV09_01400 [Roseivivax sp. THAF197b]QFT45200.1 hypothetical protein FIU97_01310 [Roseivivax sp. THAF40]